MSNNQQSDWRLPDGRFKPRVFGLGTLAAFMAFAAIDNQESPLYALLGLAIVILLITTLVRLLQAVSPVEQKESMNTAQETRSEAHLRDIAKRLRIISNGRAAPFPVALFL